MSGGRLAGGVHHIPLPRLIHIQIPWGKAGRVLGTAWERSWLGQGLGTGCVEGDGSMLEKTARKKKRRGFPGKIGGFPAGITVL